MTHTQRRKMSRALTSERLIYKKLAGYLFWRARKKHIPHLIKGIGNQSFKNVCSLGQVGAVFFFFWFPALVKGTLCILCEALGSNRSRTSVPLDMSRMFVFICSIYGVHLCFHMFYMMYTCFSCMFYKLCISVPALVNTHSFSHPLSPPIHPTLLNALSSQSLSCLHPLILAGSSCHFFSDTMVCACVCLCVCVCVCVRVCMCANHRHTYDLIWSHMIWYDLIWSHMRSYEIIWDHMRSYDLISSRGGGLGSRPKKMYGERLGDGVEYHLMSPTPRR